MTMTQFLSFLRKQCAESISGNIDDRAYLQGKDEAFRAVLAMIDVFQSDYAEQKKLTKQAEQAFIEAIETDKRRQFDDPIEMIEHVQEIASRQPFFDSEHVSLAAIQGFCDDFLHRHRNKVYQEQIQHAPF